MIGRYFGFRPGTPCLCSSCKFSIRCRSPWLAEDPPMKSAFDRTCAWPFRPVLVLIGAFCLTAIADDEFHQTKRVDIVIKEPVWSAEQKSHWAFVPPVRPQVPQVKNSGRVRNEIDAFILDAIEKMEFETSPEADARTLIRRVTFDLTGLPPTPAEVEAFLADKRPDAYERLVEDLMNRPAYGERWGRWWLDLARFAESDGFKADDIRPNAWRYRDWVIDALQADMPYDRFVAMQLAGDEIEPNDPDAFVATGLNRNYPYEYNNMVPGLNRQLILDDIVDTNAALLMGMTVACARCHDHKYDPISQKDYYRFEALFGGLVPKDDYPVGDPAAIAVNSAVAGEFAARIAVAEKALTDLEQPYWTAVLEPLRGKMSPTTKEALDTPSNKRTDAQVTTIRNAMKTLKVTPEQVLAAMSPADRNRWTAMKTGLGDAQKTRPPAGPVAIGMTDTGRDAQPVRLLIKGNFHLQAEEVPPGFLSVLSDKRVIEPKPTGHATTGTRTELVRWLTSPDHPLTARVVVNRLWQQHFGRGIVATPSDFGTQGMEPTHPELLDYLALRLIREGWSLKAMHRLMVTSGTYRLSSKPKARAVEEDPDNLLFSHQTRRRLDAEMVRDSVLAVSGRLNPAQGGPSVRPPLPAGIEAKDWVADKDETAHRRRSVYIFAQRNVKFPFLESFDLPDSNLSCPERLISVNAPQALMMLNSDFAIDEARAMARTVIADSPGASDQDRIERIWMRAVSRKPEPQEMQVAAGLLANYRAAATKHGESSSGEVDPKGWNASDAELAAWADLCHVVLNLNEFVFVD
ncbi:DUF1553 domain-containing protein [bacterium]|nr:DUF1553 domain-containing protein [bacterium]